MLIFTLVLFYIMVFSFCNKILFFFRASEKTVEAQYTVTEEPLERKPSTSNEEDTLPDFILKEAT